MEEWSEWVMETEDLILELQDSISIQGGRNELFELYPIEYKVHSHENFNASFYSHLPSVEP